MKYCTHCKFVTQEAYCPNCGKGNLRTVEPGDYCFVTEKDEMWASMFLEILHDNGVSPIALPVFGAGVVMKGGVKERQRIYVPYEKLNQALDLLRETFPEG